jgi:hypothetical protein
MFAHGETAVQSRSTRLDVPVFGILPHPLPPGAPVPAGPRTRSRTAHTYQWARMEEKGAPPPIDRSKVRQPHAGTGETRLGP